MGNTDEISLRERIRLNLLSSMERANINQVQLAEKLGISKGTVNNWARGNNSPDVDMVPKICKVLGISILDLYSPTRFEPQESKKTLSAAEAALREEELKLMEYLKRGVYDMGFLPDGADLTDRQAEALLGVCAILHAIFDE